MIYLDKENDSCKTKTKPRGKMNSVKQVFETLGNIELLSQNRTAIFASKETPAELYGPVQKLFESLTQLPLALAGGWQAPLEKKLLRQISHGSNGCNIIHYLARNINNLKLNSRQSQLMNDNRLLLISPGIEDARPSRRQVNNRDELMFSQIDKVLFLFLSAGGRLEEYFNRMISLSYQVFLFDHPLNKEYFDSSVVLLNEDNIELLMS